MDGNDSSNFNIGNKLISISTRNGTNQNETNIISNSGDISLKAYSSTGRSTLILRPEYFRYNYGSPEETILDISNSEFQYKGKDVILSGDPNVI
jgi:hypothetical protein